MDIMDMFYLLSTKSWIEPNTLWGSHYQFDRGPLEPNGSSAEWADGYVYGVSHGFP